MIILISSLRRTADRKPKEINPGTVLKVAAAAAATIVTVPASGFIVNSGMLMHSTAVHTPSLSPAMGWMQTFLGACAWAFMIAAGSLVYNHFVGKWQEKGYPILPVAALAAADGIPQLGRSSSIPLHRSTMASSTAPKYGYDEEQQSPQIDWMDQYEG